MNTILKKRGLALLFLSASTASLISMESYPSVSFDGQSSQQPIYLGSGSPQSPSSYSDSEVGDDEGEASPKASCCSRFFGWFGFGKKKVNPQDEGYCPESSFPSPIIEGENPAEKKSCFSCKFDFYKKNPGKIATLFGLAAAGFGAVAYKFHRDAQPKEFDFFDDKIGLDDNAKKAKRLNFRKWLLAGGGAVCGLLALVSGLKYRKLTQLAEIQAAWRENPALFEQLFMVPTEGQSPEASDFGRANRISRISGELNSRIIDLSLGLVGDEEFLRSQIGQARDFGMQKFSDNAHEIVRLQSELTPLMPSDDKFEAVLPAFRAHKAERIKFEKEQKAEQLEIERKARQQRQASVVDDREESESIDGESLLVDHRGSSSHPSAPVPPRSLNNGQFYCDIEEICHSCANSGGVQCPPSSSSSSGSFGNSDFVSSHPSYPGSTEFSRSRHQFSSAPRRNQPTVNQRLGSEDEITSGQHLHLSQFSSSSSAFYPSSTTTIEPSSSSSSLWSPSMSSDPSRGGSRSHHNFFSSPLPDEDVSSSPSHPSHPESTRFSPSQYQLFNQSPVTPRSAVPDDFSENGMNNGQQHSGFSPSTFFSSSGCCPSSTTSTESSSSSPFLSPSVPSHSHHSSRGSMLHPLPAPVRNNFSHDMDDSQVSIISSDPSLRSYHQSFQSPQSPSHLHEPTLGGAGSSRFTNSSPVSTSIPERSSIP